MTSAANPRDVKSNHPARGLIPHRKLALISRSSRTSFGKHGPAGIAEDYCLISGRSGGYDRTPGVGRSGIVNRIFVVAISRTGEEVSTHGLRNRSIVQISAIRQGTLGDQISRRAVRCVAIAVIHDVAGKRLAGYRVGVG